MDKNNKLILAACAVASFYLLLRYSALIAMLDIFKESRDRILESQNQQEKKFEEARNGTQALFDDFKKRFDNNLNRFQKDFKVRNRPDNFTEGKSKKDIVLASAFDEALSPKNSSESVSQLNESIEETMIKKKEDKKSEESVEKTKKNKNPSPYGIIIGETTEKEIFSKFSEIKRSPWTDIEGYTAITLDEKGFYSKNLTIKEITVIVNPQGIVVALQSKILGKRFAELHSILAHKYAVTYIQNPFVGDRKGEYEIGNIEIILDEAHLSFDTVLTYVTKEASKLLSEYIARCNEQKKQEIADSL